MKYTACGDILVLIVDDEKNIRRSLEMVLGSEGYQVRLAGTGERSLEMMDQEAADIVLLDVRLPGMGGLQVLRTLRELYEETLVIMISGLATLRDAVEATRIGAFDFLEKPLDRDRVVIAVRNAAEKVSLARRVSTYQVGDRFEMIGRSQAMGRLLKQIQKVATTRARVLITGDSGTGKELVARSLHQHSDRANGPFVKVNCAAIPHDLIESELFGHEKGAFTGALIRKRGQFELANRGTLFLDEIGDMSLAAQAKVLRALQTGEFSRIGGERSMRADVRVIAATNKDLQSLVESAKFREDLYFRLNVVPIHCPPLRERTDDIPLLVEAFVRQFCQENGIRQKRVEPQVVELLKQYPWPGNIRELKNLIERLVIMSDQVVTVSDIPENILQKKVLVDLRQFGTRSLKEFKGEMERQYILLKLEEFDWNITQTAAALGIERTNLHKKIKAANITRADRATPPKHRV